MSLRQHNSKHLDRTSRAAVLPVWTASAVERITQALTGKHWVCDCPAYLRDLLHAFMGSVLGTVSATANPSLMAIETSASNCAGLKLEQGGKQVGRAFKLRRGYQRISSQPVA